MTNQDILDAVPRIARERNSSEHDVALNMVFFAYPAKQDMKNMLNYAMLIRRLEQKFGVTEEEARTVANEAEYANSVL